MIHLDPKFVHFDQISGKKFVVNFYTTSGEEVDYGYTFGHVSKCLVLGCNDPRLYQVCTITFVCLLLFFYLLLYFYWFIFLLYILLRLFAANSF